MSYSLPAANKRCHKCSRVFEPNPKFVCSHVLINTGIPLPPVKSITPFLHSPLKRAQNKEFGHLEGGKMYPFHIAQTVWLVVR